MDGTKWGSFTLRCIDLAIPFPIIFELQFSGKVKSIAALKRPHQTDASKWVVSAYFDSEWTASNTPRKPLPMVFDLKTLYRHLLQPLIPYPAQPGENLQMQVERVELIALKQRELERCKARLHKEKQFNRKVVINAELRKINNLLSQLKQ